MEYTHLGKSDLIISKVGFGCMSLSDNHEANASLLHRVVAGGINYFDTADLYQKGFNEETVGLAFKGMRDKVILATKVGNQWRSDGSGWDWNPGKKHILEAVDKSLARLQTDYIDLYQLHGGTLRDPIDDTIEGFERLRSQGKIRYYGISSIRPNVIREYVKRSDITSVMIQYSLLDRRPEESCLLLLKEHNIGVLARGPLAGGLLVDKPAKNYLSYDANAVALASQAIDNISNATKSKTAIAIGFVLNHPAITTAVVGIRTPEQLQACIQASKNAHLTYQEIDSLQNAIEINQYQEHR